MSVRVINGANEGVYPVAGKTIGDVRKGMRDTLHLSPKLLALRNGNACEDNAVLADGDNLEFCLLSEVLAERRAEELTSRFREFVIEAFVDVHDDNSEGLSQWVQRRCNATDYTAPHADVLQEVFHYPAPEETESVGGVPLEIAKEITQRGMAEAILGEWDEIASNRLLEKPAQPPAILTDDEMISEEDEEFIRMMQEMDDESTASAMDRAEKPEEVDWTREGL